ncbi:MAG: DNA polymerase III subunit gamma/tau C-terminal domain-containing protein, partial [Burkholderiaceae bacterium]
ASTAKQGPSAALRNDAPAARVQAPAPMRPAPVAAPAPQAQAFSSAGDDVPAWEDAPPAAEPLRRPAVLAEADAAGTRQTGRHEQVQGQAQERVQEQVQEPAHEPSRPVSTAGAAQPSGAPDDGPDGFETMHIPDEEYFDDAGYEPVGMGDPDDASGEFLAPQGAQEDMVPAIFATERKKGGGPRVRDMTAQAWPALAASLPVTGLAAELARQSEWLGSQGDQVTLRVAIRTLAESPGKARLCTVLSEHFGAVIQLVVEYGATGEDTAHAHEQMERAERQKQAEQAVADDPFVQTLVKEFGAQVVPGSISATPRHKAA